MKKYNEIISRSLDIMTNENDFKNYLPDFMEFMRDSKVELKKIMLIYVRKIKLKIFIIVILIVIEKIMNILLIIK